MFEILQRLKSFVVIFAALVQSEFELNERKAKMGFWKVMNIAASCLLGILVYRIASRQAKEHRLFEKRDTEE